MSPELVLSWFGFASYQVAILVAFVIGGPAERAGGAIAAANVLLTTMAQLLAPDQLPYFAFLAIDLLAAAAFGVLALRAPEKLWPGVAGVGQTMVIVFSATRALDYPLSELAYEAALNLSCVTVGLALAIGAVLARRERAARPGLRSAQVASPTPC